ncbi:DNA gyrase inhibitor YacG [Thermaurantiacus sp.]
MSLPAELRPCPRCRKAAAPAYAPFCSAACRNRDLLDWLEERHVIPGPPVENGEAQGH